MIDLLAINNFDLAAHLEKPSTVLISTAYCLEGRTASGEPTRRGIAASNLYPFGTQIHIESGPLKGTTVVIKDRSAPGATQLDLWMSCSEAIKYGRRTVLVRK